MALAIANRIETQDPGINRYQGFFVGNACYEDKGDLA